MRATLPAMSPARGVAIVLSAAALCAPAAALGQGSSGAGDDQYADPFSEEPTGGGGTSTGSSGSGGGTLTQEPNLGADPGSGSTGTSTGSTTSGTATGTTTATGSLPNTGSDPRLAILAGLALLLSGLGLRLRTADEVF